MIGPVAADATLKPIGFWKDTTGVFVRCPMPQRLVKRGWEKKNLPRILKYLRSGHDALSYEPEPGLILSSAYCGWSTCRFRCAQGEQNGSGEFTDGEWTWPEGLAHYVERHEVMLPDEFVQSMCSNNWTVPPQKLPKSHWKKDYTFWLEWSAKHRPIWYLHVLESIIFRLYSRH